MKRNYENFIDAFMEYTEFVEAPVDYLKWSCISVVAGALGRKTWINFRNGQSMVFPNLYIMLIGAAGLARKSTSSGFAVDLINQVPEIKKLSTTFTPAAMIEQLSQGSMGAQKVVYQGKEYPHSSLFCYASEAVNTLKDREGGIITYLTDFYDCGLKGWNDKMGWEKHTKCDGKVTILNPCVNFLGCSTPSWLTKSIGESEVQGGFVSRIMMVCHEGVCDRDFGWQDLPDRSHMRPKLVEDLLTIANLQGELKTSKEYKLQYMKLDKANNETLAKIGETHALSSYYARKMLQVMKLSQVLHVCQSNTNIISGETLMEALALVESLEDDMRDRFVGMTGSDDVKLAGMLWRRIASDPMVREEGLPISTAHLRGWFPQYNRQDIAAAVSHLVSVGKLTPGAMDGNGVIWHHTGEMTDKLTMGITREVLPKLGPEA